MDAAPWLLLFPGLFFCITLFALNFLGDGLRDALDPNPQKRISYGTAEYPKSFVNFHSREGIVQAVNDIDLEILEGEIVGLVGESGSGKSVTCNSILQLLPCPPAEITQGAIHWTSKDLLKQKEQICSK